MSLHSELQTLGNAVNALLQVLGGQYPVAEAKPRFDSVNPPLSEYTQRSTGASKPYMPQGTVPVDQGKLLQLVNMTRRFVRYSREGNIPSKEQRKYARRSIKAVKHLLPPREVARSVS